MSISQFMASGAAIAATATNEMLANNAEISETFFSLFENNTEATLDAASNQADNIQENIHDQAMNQEFTAIGNMVGGGLGSVAGLGGFAGATYFGSSPATENELALTMQPATPPPPPVEMTTFNSNEGALLDGSTEDPVEGNQFRDPLTGQVVDPTDGTLNLDNEEARLEAATQANSTDQTDAQVEDQQNTKKQTEEATNAKQNDKAASEPRNAFRAQLCERLASNAQAVMQFSGSPFGLVAASYTADQAAPQSASTIYQAVGQALNSNTGLVTTALQNRDSSTANVQQLMSTLIHASGGVAG